MDPLAGWSDDASVGREANDRRRPTERPMMANVERFRWPNGSSWEVAHGTWMTGDRVELNCCGARLCSG
jgi:hypothetical protein